MPIACLADDPSRLPTHSFIELHRQKRASSDSFEISQLAPLRISSCVISDGIARVFEMNVNWSTNQDYIEEEVSRRSQINHNARETRTRRSLQFTNLFSNLATAEFPSIIDALCGRVSDRGKKIWPGF